MDGWRRRGAAAHARCGEEGLCLEHGGYLKQEAELIGFFEEQGLDIYEPDVAAFRAYAWEQYLKSPLSASWPEGMLERINAL